MTTRDAFAEEMKTKIDEWNSEIEKIERQLDEKSEQARKDAEAQLDELKRQRDKAKAALAEVQGQSESGWEEARSRTMEAWSAFSASVGRAFDSLRGKTDA